MFAYATDNGNSRRPRRAGAAIDEPFSGRSRQSHAVEVVDFPDNRHVFLSRTKADVAYIFTSDVGGFALILGDLRPIGQANRAVYDNSVCCGERLTGSAYQRIFD